MSTGKYGTVLIQTFSGNLWLGRLQSCTPVSLIGKGRSGKLYNTRCINQHYVLERRILCSIQETRSSVRAGLSLT